MAGFARTYHKIRREIKDGTFRAAFSTRYLPSDVGKAYMFPPGDGSGTAIGLIELGGGFTQSGVDALFQLYRIPSPVVTFRSVDGGTNTPDGANGADGEVMLDIGCAGNVAPKSTIVVYTSPNTEQGFVDAVLAAVSDGVDAISISWGAPEKQWSKAGLTAMEAAFSKALTRGVAVLAASGDNGSSDGDVGNNVDFPASSPFVTGCGGTALTSSSEQVWNDGSRGGATGGGLSSLFGVPDFQKRVVLPAAHRGVPDWAGNADPQTGYSVVVDGQTMVIGGTSAVAPLFAGLVALLNQLLGKKIGFLNPMLYGLPANCFKDIIDGNNGTYTAKKGYDLCTGLGSPNGVNILHALGGVPEPIPVPVPVPVPPAPVPTPTPAPPVLGTVTLSQDTKAGTYSLSGV